MNYYQKSKNTKPASSLEVTNGYCQLKADNSGAPSQTVNYHFDHSQRTMAERRQMFAAAEKMPVQESYGTNDEYRRGGLNLHRHELFPGYFNVKPTSLQK